MEWNSPDGGILFRVPLFVFLEVNLYVTEDADGGSGRGLKRDCSAYIEGFFSRKFLVHRHRERPV